MVNIFIVYIEHVALDVHTCKINCENLLAFSRLISLPCPNFIAYPSKIVNMALPRIYFKIS